MLGEGVLSRSLQEVPPSPLPHSILLATEARAAVSRDMGCGDGELGKDINCQGMGGAEARVEAARILLGDSGVGVGRAGVDEDG